MEDFPPNSKHKDPVPPEEKHIERVTSSDPIQRKTPLAKRLAGTFIGGTPRNTMDYVVFQVVIPAARDMLADAATQGFERLIFGEGRAGRRRPMSNAATGHISYNRFAQASRVATPRRSISQRARANHDFGELVLQSRAEAESVIERMYDILGKYETVSVSDLYELVGIASTHQDRKWGWSDLRGANVSRVRNCYLLDLPEPEPFDY